MPISISDSIQLNSALPLDSRSVAKSEASFNVKYPSTTYTAGQVTYFTDDKELKVYDGTSWNAVALESDIPTKTSQLENDSGYLQDLTNITASRTVSSLNLTVTTSSSKSFTTTLIPSSFTYRSYYHWDQSSTITSTCDIYLDSLSASYDNSVHARGFCRVIYSDASKLDDDLPINMQTFMSFLCGKQIDSPTLCRGRYTITDFSSRVSSSTSITLFGLSVTDIYYLYTPSIDLVAKYSDSGTSFMVTHAMNSNTVATASAGTLSDIYKTNKTISSYAVMGTTSESTSEDDPVTVGFWYDFIIS